MDFLDPPIIPSLPARGGHVGHAELMGRPRIVTSDRSSPPQPPPPHLVPPASSQIATSQNDSRSVRRSSSLRDDHPSPANRAGVGAGGRGSLRPTTVPQAARVSAPKRPPVIRRTSSFEHPPRQSNIAASSSFDTTNSSGSFAKTVALRRHQRTASDSTTSTVTAGSHGRETPTHRHAHSNSSIPSFISTIAVDGCIRLYADRDSHKVSKILLTLHALTPPSRSPDIDVPSPSSGMLHPSTLLTPLAIVLEALVMERSVLRGDKAPDSSLPTLRDGFILQISTGEGELDWGVMQPYILAIGTTISSLIPYLQSNKHNKAEVEVLTKGLRVYVSKHKKVFGEVAAMYVDGYGFMRGGFWDESYMKRCAEEIGRWGDLVGL